MQRVTDTIVLGDTKNLHACSIPSLPPPTLRGALLLLLLLLHKYVPCDGFEGRKVVRLSPLNINKPNPKRRRLGGIAVATLELSSRWPPKPKKRNEWAEDGSLVLAAAKREGGRRGGRTIGSVRWRENWISNALMVAPPPPNTLTPSPATWPVPPERKISKSYSLCPVFLLPRNT